MRRSSSRNSSTSSRGSSGRSYEAQRSPRNDGQRRRGESKHLGRHRSRESSGSDNSSDTSKELNGAKDHPSVATTFDVEKAPYVSDNLETLEPMVNCTNSVH